MNQPNTGRPIDHVVLAVHKLDAAAKVYESLGFTLTPRAAHEDSMGTSNRLAQFGTKNFIELLEVDRPNTLTTHRPNDDPPFFSFGEYNRNALLRRQGMTMLVFASDNARADHARFESNGVQTYAPFEFDRQTTLPDGSFATVSFTLTFATSAQMPALAFFVCENRAQQHFWKPAFQRHGNGAQGITTATIVTDDPERDAQFVSRLFDASSCTTQRGICVNCGPTQAVQLLTPEALAIIDPTFTWDASIGPVLAGLSVRSDQTQTPAVIAAQQACGAFIEWV